MHLCQRAWDDSISRIKLSGDSNWQPSVSHLSYLSPPLCCLRALLFPTRLLCRGWGPMTGQASGQTNSRHAAAKRRQSTVSSQGDLWPCSPRPPLPPPPSPRRLGSCLLMCTQRHGSLPVRDQQTQHRREGSEGVLVDWNIQYTHTHTHTHTRHDLHFP